LARQSVGLEKSSREQLAVLEEHRRRVLEEIALLHERLGKVGEGLAASTREPPPQQAAGQQGPQAPAEQAPQQDRQQAPQQHRQHDHRQPEKAAPTAAAAAAADDDTLVLELPQASRPNRRKAASSAR
jgi:hypothetical protein